MKNTTQNIINVSLAIIITLLIFNVFELKEQVNELDSKPNKESIEIVKAEILKKRIATKDEIEKINKNTLEEIKNAAEFATNSPFPKDSELYTDVYL